LPFIPIYTAPYCLIVRQSISLSVSDVVVYVVVQFGQVFS